MKHSIKGLFVLTLLVGIILCILVNRQPHQRNTYVLTFFSSAGKANFWPINNSDGVVFVGDGVKLLVVLKATHGGEIIKELKPGRYGFRVYWGGLEQNFGISIDGETFQEKFPTGTTTTALLGSIGVGEEDTLASCFDPKTGVRVYVKFRVAPLEEKKEASR